MRAFKLAHRSWDIFHGSIYSLPAIQGRHMVWMLCAAMLFFASCKKEELYVYEVNDEKVRQEKGDKNNVKSQTEFIAIAYSDLFEMGIDRPTLELLLAPYQAFGDQKLIEQMIIKSFLNVPGASIPTKQAMDADRAQFVTNAYIKFLAREPDEFELWHFEQLFAEDPSITPDLFYFAILTSDEYRYY